MTFIALGIEGSLLTQEKDQLEYEEFLLQDAFDGIMQEESNYLNEGGKAEDDYYQYLQTQQEIYDSKKNAIETRLKVLNSQIDGYAKAVDQNIKQNCKLSISV